MFRYALLPIAAGVPTASPATYVCLMDAAYKDNPSAHAKYHCDNSIIMHEREVLNQGVVRQHWVMVLFNLHDEWVVSFKGMEAEEIGNLAHNFLTYWLGFERANKDLIKKMQGLTDR